MNTRVNPLITALYHQRANLYTDVRRFHSLAQINRRLNELARRVCKVETTSHAQMKKLRLEQQLLLVKKRVYEVEAPELALIQWALQMTDRFGWQEKETPEQAEALKEEHTLILLSLVYATHSEEKLRELIAQHSSCI